MTVALDSSGLLARYLGGPAGEVARAAMAADPVWCASALALTEALMVVDQLDADPTERDDLRRALRDDWERIHVVPLDGRCLGRAAELGRTQPVRSVHALHLAAADRLPRPVTFLTFDPDQIPVALALGFDVTST
ncbi:MAG: type II toxin-antitoxin system VapC family toxin [Actinomycetota bacterium]|nr:type II toxin-antitoxin system VapC family toxin [Acidimicrobiia bacterium]MDQ3293781.1 type II toxin-antitoxin system VapC family toxin [Actinomycetota bacterium]